MRTPNRHSQCSDDRLEITNKGFLRWQSRPRFSSSSSGFGDSVLRQPGGGGGGGGGSLEDEERRQRLREIEVWRRRCS